MSSLTFQSNFTIRTREDLMEAVEALGFLPFFSNDIPGFSIEDHIDPEVWFSDAPGPWEWKGPVIRELGCAYGKFFGRKAVYVSREWFPDFANHRRDGYDYEGWFNDGLASFREKELYDLLEANGPVTSRALKRLGGYRKDGKKGFETLITRLQEQCFAVISDFVYEVAKDGRRYGWGVAEYATPERFFGEVFAEQAYAREPEESRERIAEHLRIILPAASDRDIWKLLR